MHGSPSRCAIFSEAFRSAWRPRPHSEHEKWSPSRAPIEPHSEHSPYQAFETADGYVVVASEPIWERFCRAIDRPDLLADDRFRTNEDRVRNRDALDSLLDAAFAEYETDRAIELLREFGVPASAVNDVADVFDHPRVRARSVRRSVEHPTAGRVEMPGSPMHFSHTPTSIRRHPPLLGEHTDSVLREYGYGHGEIERLREADAI